MSTDSYLEYVLLLLGWILNNGIWAIITSTGIFAIPIAFKLIGIWLKVREEGDDEGNKGALAVPRMEHAIYMSFLVILFCGIPVMPIDLNTISFDTTRAKECGVSLPDPGKTGYKSFINEMDGKTAKVPLWWMLVHKMSKGVTRAAVATIPCGTDVRQVRFDIQHTQIKDPVLTDELQAFANDCYARSLYRLKSSNTKLDGSVADDVNWIGASTFLNNSGYYDTYTSSKPLRAWNYDASRDAGYPDVGQGGYPTCKDWWENGSVGLKHRLKEEISPIKSMLAKAFGPQGEETALRWLVSPRNATLSGMGESYMTGPYDQAHGVGGNLKRGLATIGTGMEQIKALPGIDAMKQALPIVQSSLLMVVTVVIPLLMLFSAYEPKTVMTVTFALFALIFVSFWWELATWLDNSLIKLMYDNQGDGASSVPFADFVSSTSDGWIMNIVIGGMYVAMPAVWIGTMGWTGVQIGNVIATSLGKATKGVEDAGSKGSEHAGKAVKTVATKGKM